MFRFPFWAGWAALIAAATVLYIVKGPPPWPAGSPASEPVFYQCWFNIHNCADFRTQGEAQALFRACGGRENDVHRLDGDGDGIACEWSPRR